MTKLVNRAKMTTATTGTGTITLGSAQAGYQSFADAGVVDADVVRYVIEDGTNWEIGTGTFDSAAGTLTRSPSESSIGGGAITLTGEAVVFVGASASDIVQPNDNVSVLTNDAGYTANTGTVTSVAATAGTGISISGSPITTSGTLTITNTAPDQTVSLAGSGATSISGIYPNFTISSTDTTYSKATATTLGLVELGSNTVQTVAANAVSTTAARTYAIQLNSADQMVVNVPWLDTNTTYSAGNGITLTGTTFSVAAGGGMTQDAGGLSHADTSSQVSVDNSGTTVIQDVTLDTYGHVTALGSTTLSLSSFGVTATSSELNVLDGITATTAELNILDGVTATTAELNYLDITTLGVGEASKAVTADANGNIKLPEEVQASCYLETAISIPSTTINCNEGNVFFKTISANTTFTFDYSGVNLTTDDAYSFTLILTASGTIAITWPASVDWSGGSAPDSPANGETDVLVFVTRDGGVTWYGFQSGDAMS